jgi:multidrug efflux pump subunit AcrA (membrane-fusion protein)
LASGLVNVVVSPDPGTPPSPPGLIVRGEIETGRLKGVVLVPTRGVVRSEDRQVVVLAGADHAARIVPVKVLGAYGELSGVEGDVKAGDHVIVEGGYNLPAGAHVVETAALAPAEHAGGSDGK